MTDTRKTSKGSIDRFWDQFIERARKKGIKETAMRWFVLRAEQYLKAFSETRLVTHSTEDVTGYLEKVGRIDGISDWQFAQIVDAIQNLLQTAGAPAAETPPIGKALLHDRDTARNSRSWSFLTRI